MVHRRLIFYLHRRQSNIANTPVGQLIVAAAIVDDMIARKFQAAGLVCCPNRCVASTVVILSQLQAFTGDEVSIVDMSTPIVSALAFLAIGGYIAVFVLPKLLDRYVLDQITVPASRDWASLCIMFALVLLLLPATYYCKASPLMGAFLAGLAFCSNSGAHHMFVSQCKRPMHWLLRIFFAASIGFQVPIKLFGDTVVLFQGALLTLALLGKVLVGFMAPNFSGPSFREGHLRDCLVIGFSMAAEGEFAFVIAAFAVSNQMISQELYASIVLAVLVSTIVAPFSLRSVISYYDTRMKASLTNEIDKGLGETLEEGIRQQTTVFYCLQTRTTPAWGIQANIIEALSSLQLEVIDYRSWHPRHSPLLINEIYAKDLSFGARDKLEIAQLMDGRIDHIHQVLKDDVIRQDNAVLNIKRWFPEQYLLPIDETQSDSSSDDDMNARLIQATTSALTNSMRDEEVGRYIQMPAAANRPDPTGHHLESEFDGHLDGLIRRDSPRKLNSFG